MHKVITAGKFKIPCECLNFLLGRTGLSSVWSSPWQHIKKTFFLLAGQVGSLFFVSQNATNWLGSELRWLSSRCSHKLAPAAVVIMFLHRWLRVRFPSTPSCEILGHTLSPKCRQHAHETWMQLHHWISTNLSFFFFFVCVWKIWHLRGCNVWILLGKKEITTCSGHRNLYEPR